MFCWMDNWFNMSLEEIRNYEQIVSKDLDKVGINLFNTALFPIEKFHIYLTICL